MFFAIRHLLGLAVLKINDIFVLTNNYHQKRMNYTEILNLIKKRLLNCALDKLGETGSSVYGSELEGISTTYRYMTGYMLDNVDDTQRGVLYNKLLCQTYELLNAIHLEKETDGNPGIFFQKRRLYNNMSNKSLESVINEMENISDAIAVEKLIDSSKYPAETHKRLEEAGKDLFGLLWINTRWSNKNCEEVKRLFSSATIHREDKILALGAIYLSLLTAFDIKKYLFIIECCNSSDIEIRSRAAVIFMIISNTHDDIIQLYPEATDRIKLLEENTSLKEYLATIAIQFYKTLDTKTIDKKFKEEIIPELMKKQSEMKDKMGNELIDENSFNEMNPEWQADMENSPLAKKIKEIGDLQQEGFDVYMGTFAQLKTFPFFSEVANWFYPFTTTRSETNSLFPQNSGGKSSLMSTILQTRSLCDSDKYSFCFTLTQVPESQRGIMTAQIDGQIEQQINDSIISEQTVSNISNTYIQNLYRFHNLNSHRAEFRNIFNGIANITDTKCLKSLTDFPQANLMIAEFLFKNSHYMLSYPFYRKYISETECNDPRLYQRIGYNAQRLGKFDEAINFYTAADSLSPNNVWVLSHLAYCYTMKDEISRALDFYRLIELLQRDNLKNTLQICKCLIKDRQYRKATETLYKIYFEHPENTSALRMLGWCMLELGNREDALKFFRAMSEANAQALTANDHANLAHAMWINGKTRDAVNEYGKCMAMSKDIFNTVLKDDAALLNRFGITETDILIMKDIIISNNK